MTDAPWERREEGWCGFCSQSLQNCVFVSSLGAKAGANLHKTQFAHSFDTDKTTCEVHPYCSFWIACILGIGLDSNPLRALSEPVRSPVF